jgi:SAM-dependent methyltransferase
VITLLDVIEHLNDPVGTLADARRALRPGGIVVVGVPAHPRLWSQADELLGHVCRYTRPRLKEHLEQAGFQVLFSSHVFSWLVLPVWLQRRLATNADAQLGLDRTSLAVDRLALLLTRAEQKLIGRVSLPIGTSIVAVGRK